MKLSVFQVGLICSVGLLLSSCDGAGDQRIHNEADDIGSDGAASVSGQSSAEDATSSAPQKKAAAVPLGLPTLPDAVLGYEIDRSSGGNVDYSGSFNTDMAMDDALGFYVDAITQDGGSISHDGRGDPGDFRSIQGTLSGGETFYISVSDLRDDKGYVQLDIKLKEQ